jgi:hypothetical protein
MHTRNKPRRKQFGKQLTEAMNEANQPEVSDFLGDRLLAEEYHISLVKQE